MKTKFMHLLLIIPIIFVPSTYAAEECAMEIDESDDIKGRVLNADSTRAAIIYKNLIGKIRNLETGEDLFEGKNIAAMHVNSTRTSVLFVYVDYTTEMRHLENGGVFCTDHNVEKIMFKDNIGAALFLYKNGGTALKNLENGNPVVEDKDAMLVEISKKSFSCFHKLDSIKNVDEET